MLQDDSAENRQAHGYLQYLAATLLSHVGALKYTATSKAPPLNYSEMVVVSALAFPTTVPWSDQPARAFLDQDPEMCRSIVLFAAENHVRVQSFIKAGESFSHRRRDAAGSPNSPPGKPAAGGTTVLEQAVESIMLAARFLCGRASAFDALLVDLDEEVLRPHTQGGPLTTLRMELHRALCNFLLRHMFFRMAPDAKELRKLPKPLYIHVDLLPAWPVAASFTPGSLPSLPHELLHEVRASEDPIIHALMNVFGFSARRLEGSPSPPRPSRGSPASRSRSLSQQSTEKSPQIFSPDFSSSVSFGKIPVQQSTWYDEHEETCNEEEENDSELRDMDGGLPWLQLMDDLKFIAPFLNNHIWSEPALHIPNAFNFSTLSPAEAVTAQLRDGPSLLTHCLISTPEEPSWKLHQDAALRSVQHYGSSLLSLGLQRILVGGDREGALPSYPVSAEYVGDEFRIAAAASPLPHQQGGVQEDAAGRHLSQKLLTEHRIAFGVVQRQSLRDAVLVSAHNILGLTSASIRCSERHGAVLGHTAAALDGMTRLLVDLAERVYARLVDPTTTSAALQDAHEAQHQLCSGDVLDALVHCGKHLASSRNAVFRLSLITCLKTTAEQNETRRGGRAAAIGAADAIRAVRVLVACGARARRSVCEEGGTEGSVKGERDGRLTLVIRDPTTTAAEWEGESPPGSTRSRLRRGGQDDFDDLLSSGDDDVFSDDGGVGETLIVIALDGLVSELQRQVRWLRLRQVPCETAEAALHELS